MRNWLRWVVLVVLWLGAGVGVRADAAQSSADVPRWILDPREREVGEVLDAALEVSLAQGERLDLDASALEADPTWVLLDGVRRERKSPTQLVVRWSLASLEPGERSLPTPALLLIDPTGARRPLAAPQASARFTGVLAVGEDEPRAPLGFRPIEAQAGVARSRWPIAIGALAVGALLALWLVLRRRRKAPIAPPDILERLAALEARPLDARDEVREVYYALTALVREHVDERLGAPRPAATDAEWIRALAERAPAAVCDELAALLREAEPVKYAAHQPTHWAVRESFERARRALSALDSAPRRAA